jgi:hypothetical protein
VIEDITPLSRCRHPRTYIFRLRSEQFSESFDYRFGYQLERDPLGKPHLILDPRPSYTVSRLLLSAHPVLVSLYYNKHLLFLSYYGY